MDIDRFWDLIEQARLAAGAAADVAVREELDDPERDLWDFDDLDQEAESRSGPDGAGPDGAGPDGAGPDGAGLYGAGLYGPGIYGRVPHASGPAMGRTDRGRSIIGPDASSDPGLAVADDDQDDDDITDPIAMALVRILARLEPDEIAAFELTFDHVREVADRDDLANAGVLIEHGFLGDDSFDDFRAGLVALGRPAFEAALHDPDSLASHPLVREIAFADDPRWLGREDLLFAASRAYAEATGRDEVTFFDAVEALDLPEPDLPAPPWEATDWVITDEAETRRRLPNLAALFFERSMHNRSRVLARLENLA
jgi:Protein of unknown function (DUF4240)